MTDGRTCNTKFDVCYTCLIKIVLPVLRNRGTLYRKFRQVHAKSARGGERVISVTSDGKETEVTAQDGDYIIMNLTGARERYVVAGMKFEARYTFARDLGNGFALFDPKGEVYSITIDNMVFHSLRMNDDFYIEAPWGAPQRVRKKDFFVTPPNFSEVYRIARKEFYETYRKADSK